MICIGLGPPLPPATTPSRRCPLEVLWLNEFRFIRDRFESRGDLSTLALLFAQLFAKGQVKVSSGTIASLPASSEILALADEASCEA
jgi:hypothetical protein